MQRPQAVEQAETGFFGKLPSRGDFLSRRLPSGFVEVWDAWLQAGISSSRRELGEAWAGYYVEAPVWRFFIPPRIVTERAWIGIFLPSLDRVGRHFPLTIAAGLARDHLDGPATLGAACEWLAALESVALDALKPGVTLEDFDARLVALPFPLAAAKRLDPGAASALSMRADSGFLAFALEPDERPVSERSPSPLERVAQRFALWWTTGSEVRPACVLASVSLPAGPRFCALLDGRWTEHGWSAGCSLKDNGV